MVTRSVTSICGQNPGGCTDALVGLAGHGQGYD